MKNITELKNDLKRAQEALDLRNTKDGRMADAEAYPPLSPSLWNLLKEEGFKTGSEVYAPNMESADEDWCVNLPPAAFEGYAAGVEDGGYLGSGFTSLYAHDGNGKAINILCFGSYKLFLSWRKTTEVMVQLMENFDSPFDKKWCRVRVFSALKDIFWPVRPLTRDLGIQEALKYRKCKRCGRRAEFFSTAPARRAYLDSGVCERCTEEGIEEQHFKRSIEI